jgi:hypothetical protein
MYHAPTRTPLLTPGEHNSAQPLGRWNTPQTKLKSINSKFNLTPTVELGWNTELAPENESGARSSTLSGGKKEKQQRLRVGMGQQVSLPKQGLGGSLS